MAGFSWTGGTSPEAFAAALNSLVPQLVEKTRELLVTEAGKGADMMQATILASSTPTGERRGSPTGRYVTGNMYNEVDSAIIDNSDTKITAEFGWLNPQQYFDYQENGTEAIEPMHALAQAFNQVSDEMQAGIVQVFKDMTA